MAANPEIIDYIRKVAAANGIDPEVALAVARAEALNVFDPSQPDRGGDAGSSFGPYQLHYGGMAGGSNRNPGLGDVFTKQTGLHASDPSTWKQQIDFALPYAAKHGWGSWMGAKNTGIGNWQGIGGGKATNQYAMPKAQAVGGAGVYQPPGRSNTPANATTSPSSVTPPYGQNQPADVADEQPAPVSVPYAQPKDTTADYGDMLAKFGGGLGKAFGGAPAMGSVPKGPEDAIRTDAPAVAPVMPVDQNRRMYLAQLMAALNQQRLF